MDSHLLPPPSPPTTTLPHLAQHKPSNSSESSHGCPNLHRQLAQAPHLAKMPVVRDVVRIGASYLFPHVSTARSGEAVLTRWLGSSSSPSGMTRRRSRRFPSPVRQRACRCAGVEADLAQPSPTAPTLSSRRRTTPLATSSPSMPRCTATSSWLGTRVCPSGSLYLFSCWD